MIQTQATTVGPAAALGSGNAPSELMLGLNFDNGAKSGYSEKNVTVFCTCDNKAPWLLFYLCTAVCKLKESWIVLLFSTTIDMMSQIASSRAVEL